MSRTLPEPKINASAARLLAVVGLRAFAADTFGRSLPPVEARDLASARLDAGNLAARIDAGLHTGPVLLAVRGYYLDSYGAKGQNDRNVWDDALVLLQIDGTRTHVLAVISGNVDPTRTAPGIAAQVAPQHYRVREGRHRDRRGLRQAAPVLIDRDGRGGVEYRQDPNRWPYTNVHDDRGTGTGSAGCITAPVPDYALLYAVAKGAGTIDVVLIDEADRRAGKYGPAAKGAL